MLSVYLSCREQSNVSEVLTFRPNKSDVFIIRPNPKVCCIYKADGSALMAEEERALAVSAGQDCAIKVWDISTGVCIK